MLSPRVIEVRYSDENETVDDQIAKRASDILTWDILVPPDGGDVEWMGLRWASIVNWFYKNTSAEHDVRKLASVLSVTSPLKARRRSVSLC